MLTHRQEAAYVPSPKAERLEPGRGRVRREEGHAGVGGSCSAITNGYEEPNYLPHLQQRMMSTVAQLHDGHDGLRRSCREGKKGSDTVIFYFTF